MGAPPGTVPPKEIAQICALVTFYFMWFIMILFGMYVQSMMLRLRASRLAMKPTEGELFGLMIFFWIIHLIANTAITNTLDTLVATRYPKDVVLEYITLRSTTYNLMHWYGATDIPSLLTRQIATAWVTDRWLVFSMDNTVPFILSIRRDPVEAWVTLWSRILARANELILFQSQFYQHEANEQLTIQGWSNRLFISNKYDLARLQHRQTTNGPRGGRTMVWKFTVSQVALRALRETLQRIGRFGELGFDLSGTGVSYEASGSGCYVQITFEMEDPMLAGRRVDNHDHMN